jgi:hypothetical protein
MTSDECYDDVRWRPSVLKVALLGNNCVISATGFGSKSIAALSLLKRNFCVFFPDFLRLRKR